MAAPENNLYMREIRKRIGALLKIIAPLSDPPSEKVHMLKNWSPPGYEPAWVYGRERHRLNRSATEISYIFIYIEGEGREGEGERRGERERV